MLKSPTKTESGAATKVRGFAADSATSQLKQFDFTRRALGKSDVMIDIAYCGVCHSDIHQVLDEWGGSLYPMVPGHEIVGHVRSVGSDVTAFKPGQVVGVGCMVNSCRECTSCKRDLEQFCEKGMVPTYNGTERDGKTPTYGGYSESIVVNQEFVLRVPTNLDLSATAPLLCAGITTYSPLKHWKVGKGQKVGIIGLGGLGHMGVKFANAFGCQTVVITHSPKKTQDALKLGAHEVIVSSDPKAMQEAAGSFDFLLNTASSAGNFDGYLNLLKMDATMVLVGVPEKAAQLPAFSLISRRRSLAGSAIGGIAETQEMLDFCGKHNITSQVEVIPMQQINQAYERMLKGDVRYRFSIDMKSLKA
jgi:alcohol dehydrogenase (NADP+)